MFYVDPKYVPRRPYVRLHEARPLAAQRPQAAQWPQAAQDPSGSARTRARFRFGRTCCCMVMSPSGSGTRWPIRPRGAAVAERLWSPRDAGTVDEAAIRLQRLTDRMLSRKLRVSPMGMTHVDHCENFKDPYDDDPDIVSPSFYKRGADLNESIYTDMDRRR